MKEFFQIHIGIKRPMKLTFLTKHLHCTREIYFPILFLCFGVRCVCGCACVCDLFRKKPPVICRDNCWLLLWVSFGVLCCQWLDVTQRERTSATVCCNLNAVSQGNAVFLCVSLDNTVWRRLPIVEAALCDWYFLRFISLCVVWLLHELLIKR